MKAFPFRFRPDQAQKLLSPYAALACNLGKIWPSIGASIGVFSLSFLNFDFLRPTRFSAVYFPAWIVNGEVEASVTYKGFQVRSIPIS